MDDDGVDPSFEAGMEARAAQEQCLLALLDSRPANVRQAIAERPLVVKRNSAQAARQAREISTDFQDVANRGNLRHPSKVLHPLFAASQIMVNKSFSPLGHSSAACFLCR